MAKDEEDQIPDEESPAFTEEGLDDDYDGDEEIEDDGSESPYAGADSHGVEEGEEDE